MGNEGGGRAEANVGSKAHPTPVGGSYLHFIAQEQHSIQEVYLPRVIKCLQQLPEDDIWWRPNPASNSAGNLVLHLAGNIRQWIGSGLGGKPDIRKRDREFQEAGPMPRRALMALLQKEVESACGLLARLSAEDLKKVYLIQGFRVTGLEAILHVAEHFAYHSGQIIYLTKLRLAMDLKFTRLPGEHGRKAKRPSLPAI
ncbi:MAG TPA: DUF1572 family protein [Terriglobia bacterium]|nr:DUF1572 family protein [Terriglobia bacterium]